MHICQNVKAIAYNMWVWLGGCPRFIRTAKEEKEKEKEGSEENEAKTIRPAEVFGRS